MAPGAGSLGGVVCDALAVQDILGSGSPVAPLPRPLWACLGPTVPGAVQCFRSPCRPGGRAALAGLAIQGRRDAARCGGAVGEPGHAAGADETFWREGNASSAAGPNPAGWLGVVRPAIELGWTSIAARTAAVVRSAARSLRTRRRAAGARRTALTGFFRPERIILVHCILGILGRLVEAC